MHRHVARRLALTLANRCHALLKRRAEHRSLQRRCSGTEELGQGGPLGPERLDERSVIRLASTAGVRMNGYEGRIDCRRAGNDLEAAPLGCRPRRRRRRRACLAPLPRSFARSARRLALGRRRTRRRVLVHPVRCPRTRRQRRRLDRAVDARQLRRDNAASREDTRRRHVARDGVASGGPRAAERRRGRHCAHGGHGGGGRRREGDREGRRDAPLGRLGRREHGRERLRRACRRRAGLGRTRLDRRRRSPRRRERMLGRRGPLDGKHAAEEEQRCAGPTQKRRARQVSFLPPLPPSSPARWPTSTSSRARRSTSL